MRNTYLDLGGINFRKNAIKILKLPSGDLPSLPKLSHYSTLSLPWTIRFVRRNVKITSQKLSCNYFLAPYFLHAI